MKGSTATIEDNVGIEVQDFVPSFSDEDHSDSNRKDHRRCHVSIKTVGGTAESVPPPPSPEADELNSFGQRQAKRVARNPCMHLCSSLLLALGLSAISLIVGEFSVSVNSGGWVSRGTLISNRQTQIMLIEEFQHDLAGEDSEAVWVDLTTNVQKGFEDDDDDNEDRRLSGCGSGGGGYSSSSFTERRMDEAYQTPVETFSDYLIPKSGRIRSSNDNNHGKHDKHRVAPFTMTTELNRRLETQIADLFPSCDGNIYTDGQLFNDTRLWPVWKTSSKYKTALNYEVLEDLCLAEEKTQQALKDNDLCFGCTGGEAGSERCLPPYSLVLYARLQIDNGLSLSCSELATAWKPFQTETEDAWKVCVEQIKANYDPEVLELPEECPLGFSSALVNDDFDSTTLLSYTSSIFFTEDKDVDELYDIKDEFGRGSGKITGKYDTQDEDFLSIFTEAALSRDLSLAMGSAVVVGIAMLVHTRSPFLTSIGLLQIIFSFPLAFFVYKLVAGLEFFPFLNFIGVFVIFALGADDVFVAVDKWKNARLEHPTASTEYVAAAALPDAASAMFLTTVTTAVAFFATAICPVAPVKMFAVFCGLLVLFDYIMNVLLVFPALCIYDKSIQNSSGGRPNCCISLGCCRKNNSDANENNARDDDDDENAENQSLIRRILLAYFRFVSKARWVLLVLSAVALGTTAYYSSTLELPTSSDVRLLTDDYEYEANWLWRQKLLIDQLDRSGGSVAYVVWGLTPADTGDHNDPGTWSTLELDSRFEPSSPEAQQHILGFCDDLFAEEFASKVKSDFECDINLFDDWLKSENAADSPSDIYQEHCAQANGIPVAQGSFDACVGAWALENEKTSILSRNGKVEVVFFEFGSRVRYDDQHSVLDKEWHAIESWMGKKNDDAPEGCNRAYFSSDDFWWYDTNGEMLRTAYSSAAIALGAAAAMLLLTSRSLLLTLYSTLTIAYVLTSVTAVLVSLGWALGFLESICFAILIGISCDFVLHFSHAYASLPGNRSREDRTKHALIQMGPSILAAAFTTMASACIMLFTIITFFQKFAVILFTTVIQATIGSFVVFIALVLCFGPTNPTEMIDNAFGKCKKNDSDGDVSEDDISAADGKGQETEPNAKVY